MGFLDGKRILITGLLSNRSIAYGIAKACHREGAQLAFTYQNERFKERLVKFAEEFGSRLTLPCDVAEDAQIEALFAELGKHWDGLDGLVHSIAFAPGEAIEGDFLDGITRRTVIDLAKRRGFEVIERRIMPDELASFSECFITGTAAEVTAVAQIDQWNFNPGGITKQLMDDYTAEVQPKSRAA